METNIKYSDIIGRIPKVGDKVVYSRNAYGTPLSYIKYGVIKDILITEKSVKIKVDCEINGYNLYQKSYNNHGSDELRFPKFHCNYCIINE